MSGGHMRGLLVFVLIAGSAGSAGAQTAARSHTPRGSVAQVYVQESGAADPIRGQLSRIDAATLTLLVDGQPRDIPFDHILRIDARGDSVKDGALIGAGVMVVLTILAGGLDSEGPKGPLFFWGAAYGALAGAGIDALHVGRTPIYKRPADVV